MKRKHCCDDMKYFAEFECDVHSNRFECPDCLIYASKRKLVYGIIIHDGGESYIKIKYCPWCGKKLA